MGPKNSADLEAVEAKALELLRAGDHHGAVTAVLRGFGPPIHGYLRALLGDRDAADDAFSQFSERLWKALPEFRGDASVKTWAYRVAWSAAQDWRKDAFRRRGRPFATGEASRIAAEVVKSLPTALVTVSDHLSKIRETLDLHERALLSLHVEEGLSWREVSQMLDVDEAALRKRFERLRKKIRAALDERRA